MLTSSVRTATLIILCLVCFIVACISIALATSDFLYIFGTQFSLIGLLLMVLKIVLSFAAGYAGCYLLYGKLFK